jgi:hypothetical protein
MVDRTGQFEECQMIASSRPRPRTHVVVPVMAALLALITGVQVYFTQLAEGRWEASIRHRTSAVLLADGDKGPGADKAAAVVLARVPGPIAWTAPDGTRRTGTTLVRRDGKAGSTVTVWTDRSGALTMAPADGSDALVAATLAGTAVLVALCAGALCGRSARRYWTARRAAAHIDRDWARLAPLWSDRRA